MPDILSQLFKLPPKHLIHITPLAIGLGALELIGLCYRANAYLSKRDLNPKSTPKSWDPEREIVVTGGSSGIGAAIVNLLVNRGTRTIILDISEPLNELKKTYSYKVDLANPEAIKLTAAKLRLEHGDPTVLINNAGIEFNKSILDLSEFQIRRTVDVNILAHFLLVQQFLPSMISNSRGHVLSVASLASFATSTINVEYACTKSTALALYEGLGQELRHVYMAAGVRNSIVNLGWARTLLIQKTVDSGVRDGQILEPRYVAEVVVERILSGVAGQIFVPSSRWVLTIIKALPCRIQEGMRNRLSLKRIAAF
ncbi:NAD(P)-binding protein, partial [Penicillium odoratum]|uniref:NAD(P)-binding protein n=1 Tax=Penicillium odoratum TaxID=1167516 RepID=UPI002546C591